MLSRGLTKSLGSLRFSSRVMSSINVFPRENEGNSMSVNWSLVEEGVVPKGNAFHNGRVSLLQTRLSAKVVDGKVDVKSPVYTGKYEVAESGDEISHEDFETLLGDQQEYLSSGVDLFVEDGAICASKVGRLGVRVVTDNAASALIARSLLISTPPREVDHRNRFDGWNKDPRWETSVEEGNFDGDVWVPAFAPGESAEGSRPVVAYYGGAGDKAAVQFFTSTENPEIYIGATVSVGGDAPVRALIEAIGTASDVLINSRGKALSVPSVALSNGKLVIGADDSVVNAALAKGSLYGAYNNVLTAGGISAGWNGVISKPPAKAASTHRFTVPAVVSGGKAAVALTPDNMIAASEIVFFEAGAAKKSLSEAEAAQKVSDMVGEMTGESITALLKGKKCSVAGAAADVVA